MGYHDVMGLTIMRFSTISHHFHREAIIHSCGFPTIGNLRLHTSVKRRPFQRV